MHTRNTRAGRTSPYLRRRTIWPSTAVATGTAASNANTTKRSMAPDITTMAALVPMASGRAHCQPIVSCDHMAAPSVTNTARAHPREARLART